LSFAVFDNATCRKTDREVWTMLNFTVNTDAAVARYSIAFDFVHYCSRMKPSLNRPGAAMSTFARLNGIAVYGALFSIAILASTFYVPISGSPAMFWMMAAAFVCLCLCGAVRVTYSVFADVGLTK
jgi:hypothetical protein